MPVVHAVVCNHAVAGVSSVVGPMILMSMFLLFFMLLSARYRCSMRLLDGREAKIVFCNSVRSIAELYVTAGLFKSSESF